MNCSFTKISQSVIAEKLELGSYPYHIQSVHISPHNRGLTVL